MQANCRHVVLLWIVGDNQTVDSNACGSGTAISRGPILSSLINHTWVIDTLCESVNISSFTPTLYWKLLYLTWVMESIMSLSQVY